MHIANVCWTRLANVHKFGKLLWTLASRAPSRQKTLLMSEACMKRGSDRLHQQHIHATLDNSSGVVTCGLKECIHVRALEFPILLILKIHIAGLDSAQSFASLTHFYAMAQCKAGWHFTNISHISCFGTNTDKFCFRFWFGRKTQGLFEQNFSAKAHRVEQSVVIQVPRRCKSHKLCTIQSFHCETEIEVARLSRMLQVPCKARSNRLKNFKSSKMQASCT